MWDLQAHARRISSSNLKGWCERAGLLLVLSLVACESDRTTRLDRLEGARNGAVRSATLTADTCLTCTFGPELYTRTTSKPETHVASFDADPAGAYIIEIDDLGTQGANALISLNGKSWSPPSGYVRQDVALQARNELRISLNGKPGSQLKVSIFQEVHSVTVTPTPGYTRMPATQQFAAVARDRNGVEIPGQTFEWRSSDLTVATIDANTGLAETTNAVISTAEWSYNTISTGEGTAQITARAVGTTVEGSVPWTISAGFVYTTFRAPLPVFSPNRSLRPNPVPLRYDVARLHAMESRCNVEFGNTEWQGYIVGERLFHQCFPTLQLTTTRRIALPFGLYAYDEVANVGAYGRYCGDGHPGGTYYHQYANAGSYPAKDAIDALCLEHDAQELNHELSTSDLIESTLATCIVRYGIETETLHEDGVLIQPGSARWNAFWSAWPEMRLARAHFLGLTLTTCPDGDVTIGGVTIASVYTTFLVHRGLSN